MKKYPYIFCLLVGNMGVIMGAFAQNPTLVEDSMRVSFCYAHNETPQQPDTLGLGFDRFNPIDKNWLHYLSLGNVGSPHLSLTMPNPAPIGFNVGIHQYDLYRRELTDMRFYAAPVAWSDLLYSQGGNQNKAYLRAEFARNISDNSGFGLDYQIINHLGTYQKQRARHTSFGINYWYQRPNKRYRGYFSFLTNTNRQEENGGIIDLEDSIFYNAYNSVRENVFVKLSDAQWRQEKTDAAYTQYFSLNKYFTLQHRANWGNRLTYFFDKNPTADSIIYDGFETFSRLRQRIRSQEITNEISLQSTQRRDSGQFQLPFKWRLGAQHSYFWGNQEGQPFYYHNAFIKAGIETDTSLWKAVSLRVDAAYSLIAPNENDRQFTATAAYTGLQAFGIGGEFSHQRYSPNLLQNSLLVSTKRVWANSFVPSTDNKITGFLYYKQWDSRASVTARNISHFIYYDEKAMPKQLDNTLYLLELELAQTFKYRRLFLELNAIWQRVPAPIYLPELNAGGRFYWQGKLFKEKMAARFGVESRWMSSYFTPRYQPVTGQFYLPNDKKIAYFPMTDVFFNFKVQTFRGFLKFENVLNPILNKSNFAIANYPLRDFAFRFGVAWRLRD